MMKRYEQKSNRCCEWSSVDNIIDTILDKLHDEVLKFAGKDENGNVVIVDPIEQKVIGAHYAMTHIAAALIINGKRKNVAADLEKGIELLKGVLARWQQDVQAIDFHFDFNQFALCLIWDELNGVEEFEGLCEGIKETILHTGDSRHFTINWLPMRMYVNLKRYLWTDDIKYIRLVDKLYRIIERATNEDGFIEDLLPKGKSFNLQYNLATVTVLQFLNVKGASYSIEKQVQALVNACDPEGDINYLGRGCNQIFSWGLWIYLLKARNLEEQCLLSINYLQRYVVKTIENDNLLLNEYHGSQKMLWWDYHYSSVYLGHLYLWLTLARYVQPREKNHELIVAEYGSDSGVNIVRTEDYFLCLFKGRRKYLAEYGPTIVNIWINKQGYLMKGSFGPWMGQFGRKHSNLLSYFNYLGPVLIEGYREFKIRGFNGNLKSYERCAFRIPNTNIEIKELNDKLIINFTMNSPKKTIFNIPLCNQKEMVDKIIVRTEKREMKVKRVGMVCNQYGDVELYQTEMEVAKMWSMEIAVR